MKQQVLGFCVFATLWLYQQIAFQRGCATLHTRHQCLKVPVVLYPHQCLFLSDFKSFFFNLSEAARNCLNIHSSHYYRGWPLFHMLICYLPFVFLWRKCLPLYFQWSICLCFFFSFFFCSFKILFYKLEYFVYSCISPLSPTQVAYLTLIHNLSLTL